MNIRGQLLTFYLIFLYVACNEAVRTPATRQKFYWKPGSSIPRKKVGDYLEAVLTLNELANVGDETLVIRFSLIGTSRYQILENIERYIAIQCVRKFPADRLEVLFLQLDSQWD